MARICRRGLAIVWRGGRLEFYDLIPAGGFIRAEDKLQRLEVVLAGRFRFAFALQRAEQIGVARDDAGVRKVVGRIGPGIARRRMTGDLRALGTDFYEVSHNLSRQIIEGRN